MLAEAGVCNTEFTAVSPLAHTQLTASQNVIDPSGCSQDSMIGSRVLVYRHAIRGPSSDFNPGLAAPHRKLRRDAAAAI
jgi:hypothetical protein